ncbi:glycosyltransferase [Bdellovibrio sp. HCB117]|uniref:glycosyltransferase n=1 Tax=Bdellovibrio sp. HCB117 TaxID=3394359 RepID=UPI0039B593E5
MPLVSIIVPCRNEEHNIGPLLQSLQRLSGVQAEILVVDDSSTDKTFEVAARENVRVLKAPPKPEGWVGKSWACAYGAQLAQGDYFLFTDADTRHRPDSLSQALGFLLQEKADLISAPPHHRCLNWWEQGLGLFHLLPLIAAGFPQSKGTSRIYAIGQYLLISKAAYNSIGGHEALRSSLTEDIDMAKRVLEKGLKYRIFPKTSLYEVQMYDTAKEFWRGWIRLLRLGMKKVSFAAFLEITLVYCLFFQFTWMTVVGLLFLGFIQRQHGRFSWWGVLLAPLSLILFAVISMAGVLETLRKKKVTWQERDYVEA